MDTVLANLPLPNHLLLKLSLAPLIVAAATLVARRWGENIGGLLIGLPLTSAPVSIFFALEQGNRYAAGAAQGAMLGLIPVVVFCTGYAFTARPARSSLPGKPLPWQVPALAGIGLYLGAVWGMSLIAPPLGWTVLMVAAFLLTGQMLLGKPGKGARTLSTPGWDLPLRVIFATLLLLGITGAAGVLGPKWGGLLSPFPIFTFVMAVFSHRQGGPGAAVRLMRGVLSGLFAYLAFFLVVTLLVERQPLALVYLLAACAALGVNGLSLAILVHRTQGKDSVE
jgi:hypothetical protein